MSKPTVYLDTNIISALFYDGGESAAVAHRLATWEWWEHERPNFSVYTSSFAEGELAQGGYRGQKSALALVRRIAYLPGSVAVRASTRSYLDAGVVPESKPGDAAHLAYASVHRMDYLLSWNHSHLANDETQRKLAIVNVRLGWRTPLLRSPFTVPKAALGQTIRRME